MDFWECIEKYIARPSGWHFVGSSGFSMSLALGVGVENLTIERNGNRASLRYVSLQGGFSTPQLAGTHSVSAPDMLSARNINKIYYNPMYFNQDIEIGDFDGMARSVFIGASLGFGLDLGMYVFGSASTITSLATTPAGPTVPIATAVGLANAIGFLDASSLGSPGAGVTFGVGVVGSRGLALRKG